MPEFQAALDDHAILDIADAETLSGDVRDALLTHVRSIKVPWAMLSEVEQQETILAIENCAAHAVRRIANIVASSDKPHVIGTVRKYVVKDDIKVEFQVTSLVDNIVALAEHGKTSAVLVLCNAAEFIGERAPARPDPDQPQLPIGRAA